MIEGRVQGVGFRYWVKRHADAIGVSGSVRNLPGGEVEVIATLDRDSMADFEHVLRTGPPAARVDHISINEISDEDDTISKFEITH